MIHLAQEVRDQQNSVDKVDLQEMSKLQRVNNNLGLYQVKLS